jgi:hypothetical protein
VAEGVLLDLRSRQPGEDDPTRGRERSPERRIRAQVLFHLLTGYGPELTDSVVAVRVRGAQSVGRLNLGGWKLRCPLELYQCYLHLGMVSDNSSHDPATPAIVALDDDARAFLDATARRVSMVKERERHRRTAIIAALSALLLLVTTASIFAFSQRNTAQTQRDNAILNQITTQAERLRSTDASLAAQLDLTGYRIRPTPDLDTALITTSTTVLSTPLTGHTELRQIGGVHSGWTHPGQRQLRRHGAVVERD